MKMADERNPYADMLRLPHHQSARHPRMSLLNRAAQFSPYAALVGFDGVIAETGRLTEAKTELSETEQERLGRKLALIDEELRGGLSPEITVRFFVPDALKDGGAYKEYTGKVRNIDPVEGAVVFLADNGRSRGRAVRIGMIAEIRGEAVDEMDEAEP